MRPPLDSQTMGKEPVLIGEFKYIPGYADCFRDLRVNELDRALKIIIEQSCEIKPFTDDSDGSSRNNRIVGRLTRSENLYYACVADNYLVAHWNKNRRIKDSRNASNESSGISEIC